MAIFRSVLHGFLPFSPVSLTELCSIWYGLKDLFTQHTFRTKLSLTIKTDDVTSSGREYMDTGSSGGEWVNTDTNVTCHGVLI